MKRMVAKTFGSCLHASPLILCQKELLLDHFLLLEHYKIKFVTTRECPVKSSTSKTAIKIWFSKLKSNVTKDFGPSVWDLLIIFIWYAWSHVLPWDTHPLYLTTISCCLYPNGQQIWLKLFCFYQILSYSNSFH